MTTPFADPSAPGGDKLPLPELNNALLVIEVTEALRNVSTAFGDSDPVRCTVHAVDGVHANKTFDDTLIFPKVLASQLRDKVGQVVVGRLGQDIGGELELQRQDKPATEAETNARKAGLVIPHPRRQPEGLAKPYHHAGDGDDLQQQLEQLDPVHHALFQTRYLKH